ncbi:MAG: Gfo/Idh/MocA family oxidoreductase, partial [Planctomycetes bacterium]|nr:Gfo/Idh/MocA family oxidoreductase [Planctomycetota bacterium]
MTLQSIFPKPSSTSVTRRRFLRDSASAIAVPYVVSSSSLGLAGMVAPSERITLGLIGCGIHGAGAGQDVKKYGAGWNLNQIFRNEDSQVIAVCDVDQSRVEMGKKKVDDHYRKTLGQGYQGCTAYGDFRELIRQDGIDAVAICTPDHWHVIPAIMAAKTGKDIICEKPLTLFVEEGRLLCNVVAEKERVFQTASENRSIDTYIKICELVRNGRIGTLQHIKVFLPVGNRGRGGNFDQRDEMPVPEGFNYEMWQGQAPVRPYVPARTHGSFRWCWDYSGGVLTDWGAHLIDLAQ